MNLFAISSITVFISNLLMAILVFRKSRGQKYSIVFGWFCLVAAIWGIGGYKFSTTTTKEVAFSWWQFASVAAIYSPVIYTHMIFEYVKLKRKFLLSIFYVVATIFLVFDVFAKELFLGDLRFAFNQFYWPFWLKYKSPIWLCFYISLWWCLLSYALWQLIKFFRNSKGIQRQQSKYFILGSIVGWAGGHGQFFPYFGMDIYPSSNFLIAIYPIILAYAILRYRLMDLDIVVKKGLVYSILVAIMTTGYLIFVVGINTLFQGFIGQQSYIINFIALFIIALLLNPLRDWIQHVLDKMFFQGTLESLAQEKQRLQQELFHKEKLAYVGQLASSVVHEIRNPLTAITAYVDHLPRKYEDPEFKKKFHSLVPRELKRIEKVVTNLLNLAKPSRLNLRTVNVCSLVDSTLTLLEHHLALKKIKIERHYGEEEIKIQADEEQLKQVFLNLFLNSIQAMEEGGELMIRTEYSVPGTAKKTKDVTPYPVPRTQYPKFGIQNSVRIIIKDTGIGMSEETIKNLFTPFYTTKKDGIGLGMVITQEIIKEHGGTLSVESEVGKGTTFTVELPVSSNGVGSLGS